MSTLKNRKVLVTGGAGFVASNLILRLLEEGADIRATYHHKAPQIEDSRITYVQCDLTQKEDCREVMAGIDYVFMCAASTAGAAVMDKTPLVQVTPNLIMNALTLEAAYEAGVEKYLWMSSNTVYPLADYPVKEADMVYGDLYDKYYFVAWMKQFSEVLCEMYGQRVKKPMQTLVLRPANLYGPYDDFEWETSHVVPALVRKVVEKHTPIEVWGDGRDVKDLMYVGDFVEAMLLSIDKMESFCPTNIGTGWPVSVRDVLASLLEIEDCQDADIVFNADKPTMIPKRLIDVSKAKETLGFEAKVRLHEGLSKTVAWYKNSRGM